MTTTMYIDGKSFDMNQIRSIIADHHLANPGLVFREMSLTHGLRKKLDMSCPGNMNVMRYNTGHETVIVTTYNTELEPCIYLYPSDTQTYNSVCIYVIS